MKALIIGIDSNIGKALANALQGRGWQIYGTSRRLMQKNAHVFYVDLEHEDTIANIQGEFDVIYACAALPNIAFCESNPKLSQQVNFNSQLALAKYCITKTDNYVFLSTAAVFDGTEPNQKIENPTTPKCIYGLHKAMAETALLRLSPKITIVRTSKVITENYKLINEWITALEQNLVIEPFHDLNLSAVPLDRLIELLQKIAEYKTHNILHISGQEDMSYSDLAYLIAAKIQKPLHLIKPKSYLSSGLTANMTFPFSSLDMSQTTQSYGILPAKLEEILNLVLKGKKYCVNN